MMLFLLCSAIGSAEPPIPVEQPAQSNDSAEPQSSEQLVTLQGKLTEKQELLSGRQTARADQCLEVGKQMDKDSIKDAGLAVADRQQNKVRQGDAELQAWMEATVGRALRR